MPGRGGVKSCASSSRIWPPQRTVVPPLTRMRPHVDAAVREADDVAVVDGLGGVFADCTAFEEEDGFAFAGELDGEGDAGGSSTGDANVCVEAGGGVSVRRSWITGEPREPDSRMGCDAMRWSGSGRG